MRYRKHLLILLVVAAGVIAVSAVSGCGDEAADIEFPEFVYRSEESLEGYKIAAMNQDVLEQIPCYCGCEQNREEYQNLKDCFYDRKTGEYDEHAASCAICLEEARDIAAWQDDGLSLKEIRDRIDEEYKDRGTPTDTPPIE
ncbi:MAG: PCYCGC motif-containing (lipo)protein [Thermoleophilia bacterium]